MTIIDNVKKELDEEGYFNHHSKTNYVRILDTPHVWGMPFGKKIMPQAKKRQAEFERAIFEIIHQTVHRCDIASLNCPDPSWGKTILSAMDRALMTRHSEKRSIQFRFLFGQTPMVPKGEPWDLIDFKAALIRLVKRRHSEWKSIPEIWIGQFYQLETGVLTSLKKKLLPAALFDGGTKMTWNHSKIIASDGVEALVGGHNLNMDLFRSYPPVHDVSVVVHGEAAYGSQLFLDKMWNAGTDLITRQLLNNGTYSWGKQSNSKPDNPLAKDPGEEYKNYRQTMLLRKHRDGQNTTSFGPGRNPMRLLDDASTLPTRTRERDLRALQDLKILPIRERTFYHTYDKFDEYKKTTGMLAVGKYWSSASSSGFKKGSELMKKTLILNAKKSICMSQMDLISAWKSNWKDHHVCHWIMEALLKNRYLTVEIVVSPLDAGAGAGGDQYSFGSGAIRTFELIQYYMHHEVKNDKRIPDPYGTRTHALDRLSIAPLCFTDDKLPDPFIEGETYKWPDQSDDAKTYTLKSEYLPKRGKIGSPAWNVYNAGSFTVNPVKSAPGNHAKIMIVDDETYAVGSDNLYPGNLSEFNYLIEGRDALNDMVSSYWAQLWKYSEPHKVSTEMPRGSKIVYNLHHHTKINGSHNGWISHKPERSTPAEVWCRLIDARGRGVSDVAVQFYRGVRDGAAFKAEVESEVKTDINGVARGFIHRKESAFNIPIRVRYFCKAEKKYKNVIYNYADHERTDDTMVEFVHIHEMMS